MAVATTQPAQGTVQPQIRQVLAGVRRSGLSLAEVGAITGVSQRAVQNWTHGGRPSPTSRDRLLDLQYLLDQLRDVYTDEGTEIWLHARQRALGGRRPVQALADGDLEAVLSLVERLAGGPRQ